MRDTRSNLPKPIGYARVSTRQQSAARPEADLVSDGIRRDDLYVDDGVSGTQASHPQSQTRKMALSKDSHHK
jgi:DNA invertase Pin-like site-specific DNA recombinase